MADGKKSFLLYCDIKNMIEQLPDDKAGALFKHILRYVNDENPETDDLIINISFEPIKQSLKRDLKKYENICNRNKNNGLKGGRPKSQKNPKKPIGLFGNPKEPKKADSDSDSDSDINNIINNKIEKKKGEKQKKPKEPKEEIQVIYPFESKEFMDAWGLWIKYKAEQFKFKYKSAITEQAALNDLIKISNGDEETSIIFIKHAISKGWKGIYEPINFNHGNKQRTGEQSVASRSAKIDAIVDAVAAARK
jgi:hypothetical protein